MSWYRSYLQEPSLYSSSPGSSPTLLHAAPGSPTSPAGRAAVRLSAGGLGSSHQQPEEQQHLLRPSLKQQHRQQHQHTGSIRAGGGTAAGAAGAGAAHVDESHLTLAAALEAAWEGGAACSSTPHTTGHAGPGDTSGPAASASAAAPRTPAARPSSTALVMQPLPPAGGCQTAAPAAAPAAAAAATTAAAPPGRPGPSLVHPGQVPADLVTPVGQVQRSPGSGSDAAPEAHPKQQQQQCQGASEGAAGASGCAVQGEEGEDLLGFDLCWEGPGLRSRVQPSPSTTTSTGSSSSSSRVTPPPPLTPTQQQLEHQQGASPADDSWESLVSSMQQCLPDKQPAAAAAPRAQPGKGSKSTRASGVPEQAALSQQLQLLQQLNNSLAGTLSSMAAPPSQQQQQQQQQLHQGAHAQAQSAAATTQHLPPPSPRKCAASSSSSSGCAEISAAGPAVLPSSSSSSSSDASGSLGAVRLNAADSRGAAVGPLSPTAGSRCAALLSGSGLTSISTDSSGGSSSSSSPSSRVSLGPLSPRPGGTPPLLGTISSGELPGTAPMPPLLLRTSSGDATSSSSSAGKAPLSPPRSGRLGKQKQQQQQQQLPPASPRAPPSTPPAGQGQLSGTSAQSCPPLPLLKGSGSSGSSGTRGLSPDPKPLASPRRPSSPVSSSCTPLLRSSSSCSSLQLALMGGPQSPVPTSPGGQPGSRVGLPRGLGGRSFVQSVRLRQPPSRPLGWWVCGGLAVAAVAGGAVAAVYGVMTYFFKMSMMYSLAWKAATGVAAVEGLAVGGWSCKNVRVQQAEAAQTAAEAARLRQQAAQELSAMRALLDQHKAAHSHEVSSLAALNERLTRLAQGLQAENSSLQDALDRAAADRKALEAAAALEVKRAETSALVGVTADATGRVAGEVEQLSRGQQQLVALVQELHEDVLGLVAQQQEAAAAATAAQTGAAAPPGTTAGAGAAAAAVSQGAAGGSEEGKARAAGGSAAPVLKKKQQHQQDKAKAAGQPAPHPAGEEDQGEIEGASSSCSSSSEASGVQLQAAAEPTRLGSSELREGGAAGLVRVSSVRGGVQAALAATVCEALEL